MNEIEQMETANGGVEATAKMGWRVDSGENSAPEGRDISDSNVRYRSQTATIVPSTEQSSVDESTHESDTERIAATVTNHHLWTGMTPYENVDGKFVFTFDRPMTWHVTTVINDTSVVTVELAPSTEGVGTHSHVLRIRQTLQPIEAERLERYQHDTYRNQPKGKTIDPLQFSGRTVAVSVDTGEQSHQWTVVLPTDSGSYLVQLTTSHTDDTTDQIDDESLGCIGELRKLGIQVLYSFRPKGAEIVVQ
ncbi:hypothetical protein [Halococcus salifodinae]|uniref:Uncharacterized protein n=1 Tax=Halococcus salifodinae DSM 8989 TaxID=1227456 RepID=M0N7Q8_9EURY|nr:hypothetical protein [Halococcus salifodinae]EMA52710.1 hypothetical protein C450_09583 [Halococcus salifodinae DSM 8989]